MLGYTSFEEAVKAEQKFFPAFELRDAWKQTLEEVVKELPGDVFGKLSKLDWGKASYVCGKKWNEVKVPITGRSQTKVRGLLGMREVKGYAFIRGSQGGFTHIYMWDAKPECRAVAWAGEPVREEIKKQLLIERKRPKHS